MLFLSYQIGKSPAVRQPTLLARLWGNKHAHILLKGMTNGKLLWRGIWKYLARLHMPLSFDPAILLLGIYLKDTLAETLRYSHKAGNCSVVSKSKTWKQVKGSYRGLLE